MIEYICESNDDYPEIKIDGFNVRCELTYTLKETIVRCKDCKFYVEDPTPIDPGWPMMCERTWQDMLEPYGFCAWGERRDNA